MEEVWHRFAVGAPELADPLLDEFWSCGDKSLIIFYKQLVSQEFSL